MTHRQYHPSNPATVLKTSTKSHQPSETLNPKPLRVLGLQGSNGKAEGAWFRVQGFSVTRMSDCASGMCYGDALRNTNTQSHIMILNIDNSPSPPIGYTPLLGFVQE